MLGSYGDGTTSGGAVRLLGDFDVPVAGRTVVIVEDIVNTGTTLEYLQRIVRERGARTVVTAALLNKPARRRVDVTVEYVGFTIEDRFVVGYGLDHAGRYRQLPYIGVQAG